MTSPKIAAIADVHVGIHGVMASPVVAGLNDRARMIAEALRRAADAAAQAGCVALAVCGDLFDVDAPSPQLIAAVVEALADAALPIIVLPGNHDQQTMLAGDHALGALAALPQVRVIDVPTVVRLPGLDLAVVPFRQENARTYIPAAMSSLVARCREGVPRAVAVHAGISDARTPPFLAGSHEAIPAAALLAAMEASGYTLALAGNWHDHQRWEAGGRWVIQCGALVPTGFDNPGGRGKYGSLVVASPGAEPVRYEIPGPRFYRVSTFPELEAALADPTARPRYVHVHGVLPRAVPAWTERLSAAKGAGEVHAYRIQPVAAGTARMDAAVTVVRSAATFDEAVDAYVGGLALPPGVTPGEVIATVHSFLGSAALPGETP